MFAQRDGYASFTFSCETPMSRPADRLVDDWLDEAESLLRGLTREVPVLGGVQRLTRVATAPSSDEWLQGVDEARRRIHSGDFSKVVLSRRMRVRAEHALSAPRVLDWLRRHYPTCTHIAYARPGGTLVSASPEQLVCVHDDTVRSDALASTTVRSPDLAEDTYLEQELLSNPKARQEHRLVVDAIVEALAPLCEQIDVPVEPRIMKLETLQHLWTPIKGRVRSTTSLLDCAHRLHPTPAVGGYPRGPALRWLATRGEQRGWFTGGIGWIDANGDGELAVVLRCAQIGGDEAELYAGAGIVADSDPQAELGETELKMRVMLEALASASGGA
jgi:menaquinone-specific isochorismate synthase